MRAEHRSAESPSRAGQARPRQPAITTRQRDPGPCPHRPGSNACKRYPIANRRGREEQPMKNATRWSPKGPSGPSGDDLVTTNKQPQEHCHDRLQHPLAETTTGASSTTPQRTGRPSRTSCSPSPKSPTSSAPRSPPCVTGATSAPDRTACASGAACASGTTTSPPGCNSRAPRRNRPDPGPGGEARRRPRWGAGIGNALERYLPRVWSPENPQTGLGKGVSTTFGGTWPDLCKDQRSPVGERAWGNEVGNVPAP